MTGEPLGEGITLPEEGSYSMSGPYYNQCCGDSWDEWYRNAADEFKKMGFINSSGYYAIFKIWRDGDVNGTFPSRSVIKSQLQDTTIEAFYEAAHGSFGHFTVNCSSSPTVSSIDIRNWMASVPPMRFTFLASCGGMESTDKNSFAWAFRKRLNPNTAVVDYNGMNRSACNNCWESSVDWQENLFAEMQKGKTILQAFNTANSRHPECGNNSCMNFFGDRDSKFKGRSFTNWYLAGDPSFSGDFGADLLFFNPNDYTFHVATSLGNGFTGAYNLPWITSNGFGIRMNNYFPGDFNGDGTMYLGILNWIKSCTVWQWNRVLCTPFRLMLGKWLGRNIWEILRRRFQW